VLLLTLTRWLIIAVAAAGAVWLAVTLTRQWEKVRRSVRLQPDDHRTDRPVGFRSEKW